MSVNTIDYVGPQPTASANAAANTNRGPTELLWDGYPPVNGWIADFIQDPSLGMHFFDDFLCAGALAVSLPPPNLAALTIGSLGTWTAIAPVGGGFGDAGVVGGALMMAPGSIALATSNQVAELICSSVGSFQIETASSSGLQGRLAFECRIALTNVTNGKRDVFIGLADGFSAQSTAGLQAGYPFASAAGSAASVSSSNNLNSTINLIGFYFPSASVASGAGKLATPSGDCNFVFQLASTAPIFCSNLGGLISNVTGTAIASNTFYKLGFIYDPQAAPLAISLAGTGQTAGVVAKAMLRVFVNGIQAATFLTAAANIQTASFPTGIMGPIVAINPTSAGSALSTGTASAGQLAIDWLRVAQLGTT